MSGTHPFQAEFERLNRAEAPAWLKSYREKAMNRFSALGLPDKRQENWRYTNLKPLVEKAFVGADSNGPAISPVTEAQLAPFRIAGALELVFIDGKFRPEASRMKAAAGVELKSLSEALRVAPLLSETPGEQHAFTALNAAFVSDGASLRVAAGARIEVPIHILYYSSVPTASHPRNLIHMEKSSFAVVVETIAGPSGLESLTNSVSEIRLTDDAELYLLQLQDSGDSQFQFSRTLVAQGRDSRFHSLVFQAGGKLTRQELEVRLEGENAQCWLDGLFMVGGEGQVDNYTTVDHLVPHGSSQELYKGILGGSSTGVFNGRVVVERDAQKTDARQTNKNLLLTDEATINTKPQLEIYADDVKCTHGATIGQLEADSLFYLRSRGISEKDARRILTFAFASEILSRVNGVALKEHLERRLSQGFFRLGFVDGRFGHDF